MTNELLFYQAYQDFYQMAEKSQAFSEYCKKAFGADFSQDGFSDVSQIDAILQAARLDSGMAVLDIGCGNGKMLQYIHRVTDAEVYGFDYSEQAIAFARNHSDFPSHFSVGAIGEMNYPADSFDLIVSLDTMYFAPDMAAVVRQIYSWLKPGGQFFCAYQEGDVMPKTENAHSTVLAQAFRQNGFDYTVENWTRRVYSLLLKKREAALLFRPDFEAEGNLEWYDVILHQTDEALLPFAEFEQRNARYLYCMIKA